jgi:hypothetical protein
VHPKRAAKVFRQVSADPDEPRGDGAGQRLACGRAECAFCDPPVRNDKDVLHEIIHVSVGHTAAAKHRTDEPLVLQDFVEDVLPGTLAGRRHVLLRPDVRHVWTPDGDVASERHRHVP